MQPEGDSHVFFFEHPAESAPIVREHPLDAIVIHLVTLEVFFQEFVLLSDLFFVSHGSLYWLEVKKGYQV